MTDSQSGGSDWIQAWIEQQREQLRRAGMPGADAQASGGGGMFNAWQGLWTGAASAGSSGEGAMQFMDLISRLPALGLAREQTETWRELLAAQAEYQQLEQELRTAWTKVQTDALTLLETMIRERKAKQSDSGAAPGSEDYRELFDLWVECGEKVFAQVAHSESYCKLQAQLGNAAVRVRSHQQAMLERVLKQYDLPTRSELNTVHKQMRELRERVATLEAQLAEGRGGERS